MRGWGFVLITVSILTMISGCSKKHLRPDEEGTFVFSPRTRYKILSFFFDGVPDPGAVQKQESGKEKSGPRQETREQRSVHGPYAAKLCEGCHERASNRLILPVEELCLNCHTLNTRKKKLHGPLASGGCTACHDPHSSPNRYLLVSQTDEFCMHCNSKTDILRREVHREARVDCTGCHDAHASDNEFLLK